MDIIKDYLNTDDGAHIYYEKTGTGPTILLVHGLMTHGGFYKRNIPVLAEEFQVISMDIRGHGFTKDDTISNYSISRCAKDIDLLINHFNLDNITLVGWSLGSFIIYCYLQEFGSEKISGACVIDMPPRIINDRKWEYGAFTPEVFEQIIDGIKSDDFNARSQFISVCFAPDSIMDRKTRNRLLTAFMRTPQKSFLAYMKELAAADYRDYIKEFPVPLLYCKGWQSQLYPNGSCQWMMDNFNEEQHLTIELFEQSGHFLPFEESKKLNKAVTEFVKYSNQGVLQ